jgi:hypothetical protein
MQAIATRSLDVDLRGLGRVRVELRRAARRGSTPAAPPPAGGSRTAHARASAALLGWSAAALWVACGSDGARERFIRDYLCMFETADGQNMRQS